MLGEVQSIPVELGSLADTVRGFIPCEWGKAERDLSKDWGAIGPLYGGRNSRAPVREGLVST